MPRQRKKRATIAQYDEISVAENAQFIPNIDVSTLVALSALNMTSIDAQIANLVNEKERIKASLRDRIETLGEVDGNGHKNLVVEYGNITIHMQQQRRVSSAYVDNAIDIIRDKFPPAVVKLLIREEPVLAGKDVLLALFEQGKITTRQLNSVLTEETETFAFQPIKIKKKKYNE